VTPLKKPLLALLCLAALRVDATPSFDAMPDKSLGRWVRLENDGPRNHPIPDIYISTNLFKLGITEVLLVLTPAKYQLVTDFTRSRIARGSCLTEERLSDGIPITISEYHEGRIEKCVLPQASSCEYLAGFVSLPGVNWAAGDLKQIKIFIGDSGCAIAVQSK
jgi:hypothetical protein